MIQKCFDNIVRFEKRRGSECSNDSDPPALLGECRDRLAHSVLTAFTGSMEATKHGLFDMADRAASFQTQSLYLAAHKVLNTRGRELLQTFQGAFVQAFDDAIASPAHRGDQPLADRPTTFSLVADEDFERELAIGKLAARITYHCSEQLTTLNRRIAMLLRSKNLELENNPLHPRAIFAAFLAATEELSIDSQIGLVLLQELDRQIADTFPSLYADLNRHLIDQGVLPQLPLVVAERGTRETVSADTQRPPAVTHDVNPNRDPEPIADVFRELLRKLAGIGAAARGSCAEGQAQDVPLSDGLRMQMLRSLTRIQKGETGIGDHDRLPAQASDPSAAVILHSLRSSSLTERSNPIDAQTLDIVALLFDVIFSDHEVPDALRAEIGRLQIPVLKVALMDKGFFSNRKHPARRLLDNIASAGVGWDKRLLPHLLKEIKAIVDTIVSTFEDDADIFSKQLERLALFLTQEEARGRDNAKKLVSRLQQSAQTNSAQSAVQEEINKRVHSEQVPPLIKDFLDKLWRLRLTEIYENDGNTSGAWADGLQTMDDLLWSIRPKSASEDRRQLVTKLPNLIRRINSGLAPLKLHAKDTERFFSQLAKLHVANLYRDTPLGDKSSIGDVPRLVLSRDPAGRAAESNADGDKASNTEVEPAQHVSEDSGERSPDTFMGAVDSLRIGSWVEFIGPRGHKSELRLEWTSQFKKVCVFMNRQGEGTMSISKTRLASRLREGSARILSDEPLTARAVRRLLEKENAGSNPALH